MRNEREAAEALALGALAWLAEDGDRLGAFMAASGAGPDDLRRLAGDPGFSGAVLDHILTDDSLVMSFCQERGLPPDAPLRARALLPGGDLPHWT
jgi:Protein of unknown function (DUF3572)